MAPIHARKSLFPPGLLLATLALVSACGPKEKPVILYPKPTAPQGPQTPLGNTGPAVLPSVPLTVTLSLLPVPMSPAGGPAVTYADVKDIFDAHECTSCHGDQGKAGLTLSKFPFASVDDGDSQASQGIILDNVLERVQLVGRGKMPPKGLPSLNPADIAKLEKWKADGIQGPSTPTPLTGPAASTVKNVQVLVAKEAQTVSANDLRTAAMLSKGTSEATYTGTAKNVPVGTPSVLLVTVVFQDGTMFTAAQPKSVLKAGTPLTLNVPVPSTAMPGAAH